MRYKAFKFEHGPNAGKWAVGFGQKYFSNTITQDEREAKITALHMTGQWHQAQIDKVDDALRKLDALNEMDPHGYLC